MLKFGELIRGGAVLLDLPRMDPTDAVQLFSEACDVEAGIVVGGELQEACIGKAT